MLSISPSQIDYVIALHKTGSFSEAAELCYVTQSTLSTMIKRLEEQVGFKIFNRKSKPITVTVEGRSIINQFKVIDQEYSVLEEIIQKTKEVIEGTLSIGIIPTLAPFLLPLFLDRLVTDYSHIKFYIYEITTQEIVQRIKSRELDIGLLSIPINDKELEQTSLFTEEFFIYDTSDRKPSKKRYKIKDIDISRLWLLEESHCLTNQIGHICHLKKKSIATNNLIFNSGSIISLLELVKINKGLTLLPRLALGNSKLIDPKHIYKIESPTPAREIGLVTHSNFVKRRILKVLEKEIMNSVKPILKSHKKVIVVNPY